MLNPKKNLGLRGLGRVILFSISFLELFLTKISASPDSSPKTAKEKCVKNKIKIELTNKNNAFFIGLLRIFYI